MLEAKFKQLLGNDKNKAELYS